MTGMELLTLALWGGGGFAAPVLASRVFRQTTIDVEDEEAVLVTSHGKLVDTLKTPGLHVYPTRIFPWVKLHRVSLARDFREIENIHVNDASGTSVVVDIWVEFRIVDPAKALFSVDEWERALHNLVSHSALSMLGNREFKQILCDRDELGELVRADVAAETARWGIAVELVFLRNVSLLPDVARQVFMSVAAKLERAKAAIEEEGRLRVALLEAETSSRVAELVAEAKGQYPESVGRALAELKKTPGLLAAYSALYELSLIRAHRTQAFLGFSDGKLSAADAAMVVPPNDGPRVTRAE